MPIPEHDREQIQQRFSAIKNPVKLDYFHQSPSSVVIPGRPDCATCEEVKEALEELCALSDRITLSVYEHADEPELVTKRGIAAIPGLLVRGELNRPVRFFGRPNLYFLPTLVEAIILVSQRDLKARPEVARLLKKLRSPAHLRVIGSATHPGSAEAALVAWSATLGSPKLQADVYAAEEFEGLVRAGRIDQLPTTFVGEQHSFVGVADAEALAQFILDVQAAGEQATVAPPPVDTDSAVPWKLPEPRPAEAAQPPVIDPAARVQQAAAQGAAVQGMRRTRSGLIVPDR